MSTYIPPPGGYPQGPEACVTPCTCLEGDVACEDLGEFFCEDEYSDTGTCPAECSELSRLESCNPIVRGFASPLGAVLPVYILASLVLFVVSCVVVKNGAVALGQARAAKSQQRSLLPEGGGMPPELLLPDGTRVVGYAGSILGDFCFWLLGFFTFALFIVYWIIIADFYFDCEFTGPDNCCLLGSHPVFGDYDVNSKTFFGWWATALVWCGVLGKFQTRLRNWCRTRCPLDRAAYVWVSVETPEENLSVKTSCAISCVLAAYRRFASPNFFEETVPVQQTRDGHTRFFVFQCQRYVIDVEASELSKPDLVLGTQQLRARRGSQHDPIAGLSTAAHARKLEFLGPNAIPFEVDSVTDAMAKEFLTGFYLYQLMIYTAWIWSSWLLVGGLLATVVLLSGMLNIRMARQNQRRVQQLTHQQSQASVKRDGEWRTVNADDLVPGDVLQLQAGVIPCDCVIVRGEAACDEAGLTGESMPAKKVAMPASGADLLVIQSDDDDAGDSGRKTSQGKTTDSDASVIHPRHRLFAGSSILYHLIDIRSENSHYRERAVVSDEYLTGSGFSYDLNWLNAERVPNPEID